MNGIRTLVLQDLPYVLPSKNLQLTSSHLHTAVSSRRFWSFFEFSPKEEICQDVKKCSKDMVSSSMISSNETMEDVSKTVDVSTIASSLPLSPKIHGFTFDLKSASIDCPKIPKPLQEENLVSLLDGNPVPRTLKWKLKGYKTLRNEQGGDFAFVPGGDSGYDFDILPRNDYGETRPKSMTTAPRSRNRDPIRPKTAGLLDRVPEDTLSLTTKAIENKEPKIDRLEPAKPVEARVEESSESTTVPGETISTVQKLLPMPERMKNVKYLPISKPEATRIKCQTQPTARYSSRPPERTRESVREYLETVIETGKSNEGSVGNEKPAKYLARTNERSSEKMREGASSAIDPQFVPKTREEIPKPQPQASLAPGPREQDQTSSFENRSTKESMNAVYKTIIGVPINETPFKLSSPVNGPGIKSSPCAATQARLQGGGGASRAQSSFGVDGSSMSGNSGGGARKPPGPSPPFVALHSSSGNASLTRRLPHGGQNAPNSKNSALSISTGAGRSAPKKCDDHDEMIEGRTVCTKPRASKRNRYCESETRPKCKLPKGCKRHCCPTLQTPVDCDYDKFQCPKSQQKCKQTDGRKKHKGDPTCLPNEPDPFESRRSCYANTSRKRERSCNRDRCDRRGERRSCNRHRERSCKRQERNNCAQRDQGREICTKPKRRESCGRRKCEDRDCGRRSAKCSGRRNYTQSATEKRSSSMKRFSSVPTLGFSLIGMRMQGSESKQTLFGSPSKSRFYGNKDSMPPGCKNEICSKEASAKCPDGKASRNKCKTPSKTENICKRTEDKCKTPSKTENICKRTEDKCKIPSKTNTSCKRAENKCKTPSKTKNICKRVEDICKTPSKTNTSCKRTENKCKTDTICKRAEDKCKTPSKMNVCKRTENKCKTDTVYKRAEDKCKTPSKTNVCKRTENKCKTDTVCKRAEDKCKTPSKTDVVKRTENKCKTPNKTENSCKRTKNKCGTPRKVENKCKSTGTTSKPEKPSPCEQTGSKSDDFCSRRRELICKDKKQSASSEESVKERIERERKEMKECKKDIYKMDKNKGKDDKEASLTGFKRVASPCTQKQQNKKNDKYSTSPTKLAFIGTASNCLAKTATFMRLDNRSFNNLSDRSYSTEKHSRSNDELHESSSYQWQDNWTFDEEDNFGPAGEPIPIVIENQEGAPDDNSYAGNWFLSWFHH